MLEKLIEFYEKEYEEAENLIICEDIPTWVKPKEVVYNTLYILLGATHFAQTIGVPYDEINGIYEIYKEKLELLLDE